jgi:hypothetical protein
MTKLKHILSGTVLGLALIAGSGSAAFARDYDDYGHHDCDRDHDRSCDRDHDRYRDHDYDRDRHARYAPYDRVYFEIGRHHYRHYGEPFWYHGTYVVRAYDPYGRLVFVRVDPYTGAWLGVAFRL